MAQSGFDSSPKKFMASSNQTGEKQSKKEKLDDFVVLDIAALSPLLAADSPRLSLQRTLSRKGPQPQRAGGEKSAPVVEPAVASAGGDEGHVAGEGGGCTVPNETSQTGKCRKVAGRRPSLGVDPRRVLLFFATLSSMGTLILIYFTISMGKMSGHAADAW